jgi:hypothetical protein
VSDGERHTIGVPADATIGTITGAAPAPALPPSIT